MGHCQRLRSFQRNWLRSGVSCECVLARELHILLEGQSLQLRRLPSILTMRSSRRFSSATFSNCMSMVPSVISRYLHLIPLPLLHRHAAFLTQSVCAIHGLDVHLRVLLLTSTKRHYPVAVVQHDRIGRTQVNSQSTRSCGQKKYRNRSVSTEGGDGRFALLPRGASRHPTVVVVTEATVVF